MQIAVECRITDEVMLKTVDEVQDQCKTCQKYGQKSPRPIVTLPRASDFNESVAMDLKFFDSKIVLHIIDHFTRYSAACVIPSKHRDTIITYVLKCWISIFGIDPLIFKKILPYSRLSHILID